MQITELEEGRATSKHRLQRRGSVPHLWSEASVESTPRAEPPSRIYTPPEELLAPESSPLAYGAPPPDPPKPARNSFSATANAHISPTSRRITSTTTTTRKTHNSREYYNCKCTACRMTCKLPSMSKMSWCKLWRFGVAVCFPFFPGRKSKSPPVFLRVRSQIIVCVALHLFRIKKTGICCRLGCEILCCGRSD